MTGLNDQLVMRLIQASIAKTHFLNLLDEVERGESLIITRRGRAIARLVPEVNHRQEEIHRAVESIQARRRCASAITVEEILSARKEGREY